jgi:multidrug efflux pump
MVIASGLAIGTLFTLFVVPAFYILLAADHSRAADGEAAQDIDPAQPRRVVTASHAAE